MKYYDCHNHTFFSCDGSVSMEESCRLAHEKGAAGITFTEHVEFSDGIVENAFPDFCAYAEEIHRMRTIYPDMQIGIGLELGLLTEYKEQFEQIAAQEEWDFILGSIHAVDGLSSYNGDFSRGKTKHEAYYRYFQHMYEVISEIDCFDSLAHIDVLRRDKFFTDRTLDYSEFAEVLDPILLLLVERGQALEVNTAGWRFGIGGAHPDISILRRFRELGGRYVTCGSDCHSAASIMRDIDRGYQWIREAGFTHVTVYNKRKPRLSTIVC